MYTQLSRPSLTSYGLCATHNKQLLSTRWSCFCSVASGCKLQACNLKSVSLFHGKKLLLQHTNHLPSKASRAHAVAARAMVNVDFASPSLVLGAALIGCGVLLLQMRNVEARISKDADIVVAAMISIVGSTLIFQGWRLDPLLLLCQALTTSVAFWYGLEAFRLRSKAAEEQVVEQQEALPPPPAAGFSADFRAGPLYMQQQQQPPPPPLQQQQGLPLDPRYKQQQVQQQQGYLPPGQEGVGYPWGAQDGGAAYSQRWGVPQPGSSSASGREFETIRYDYYGNPLPQEGVPSAAYEDMYSQSYSQAAGSSQGLSGGSAAGYGMYGRQQQQQPQQTYGDGLAGSYDYSGFYDQSGAPLNSAIPSEESSASYYAAPSSQEVSSYGGMAAPSQAGSSSGAASSTFQGVNGYRDLGPAGLEQLPGRFPAAPASSAVQQEPHGAAFGRSSTHAPITGFEKVEDWE